MPCKFCQIQIVFNKINRTLDQFVIKKKTEGCVFGGLYKWSCDYINALYFVCI